jgi:hypothetical protein
MIQEIPAKGIRGHLLYSPFANKHFFRVYSDDRESFVDYDVTADDIEIELLSNFNSLYEGENRNKLDYSSKVLGKNNDRK